MKSGLKNKRPRRSNISLKSHLHGRLVTLRETHGNKGIADA
jgi:hypothetical protein